MNEAQNALNRRYSRAMQAPSNWLDNPNIAANGSYVVPSNRRVTEIRTKVAGTLNVDTINSTRKKLYAIAGDIFYVEITSIRKEVTSAALQNPNNITVLGDVID